MASTTLPLFDYKLVGAAVFHFLFEETNMQNTNLINRVFQHCKTLMIRGAIVFFPFAALIYGLKLALGIADGWLGDLVTAIAVHFNPAITQLHSSPIFSLILLAAMFYTLGSVVSWRIGNSLFKWVEGRILQIKGIGSIYGSLRKVVNMVGESDSKNKFKRVVSVPFLPEGGRTIAFVTNEVVDVTTGGKWIYVFIPTPPNPISGLVASYPEEKVADSEMTVEEAIQHCVSLGMATPALQTITPAARS
ncbi:MAG: DUF502 domain-containing protein [Candidatus Obscuribacter sp.]|nr:DUF502 domain-containing protein [Candidatus Obscuribacter sp.]